MQKWVLFVVEGAWRGDGWGLGGKGEGGGRRGEGTRELSKEFVRREKGGGKELFFPH